MRGYRGGGEEEKAKKPLGTGRNGEKGVHLKNKYCCAGTCRLQRGENPV